MKLRVEADPERVHRFLAEHNYPTPWKLETLAEFCISVRAEQGDPPETVAYVWSRWMAEGVLEIHACTKRRLWMSRELFTRLYLIAELFGAHTLKTSPIGEHAPTMRRLLNNQGWERDGGVMTKRL